jgi:mannose-6-phosphate isomerase-like protein (cupin superfamily)
MALQIRRVVTGHDATGRAVVKIDEITKNLVSSRSGATSCVVWTTQGFPVNNDSEEDEGLRKTGTTLDNGTVFRILELAPGVSPRNHRTDSIDYAVVMAGEVDMELDDRTVHLKVGDVLVQRGTIHNWVNRGTEALRDRICADRRETGHRRRQGPYRTRISRPSHLRFGSSRSGEAASQKTRSGRGGTGPASPADPLGRPPG